VIALFGLIILSDVLAILAGFDQVNLIERMAAGELVLDAEVDANDQSYAHAANVQLAAYLLTAIGFLFWFHRAYNTLPALGGTRRLSSGCPP
jgi:hypothetical protein